MFEQDQDIKKEKTAMDLYLRRLGGTYRKLGTDDVDFRIQGETGAVVGYAEVKVLDTEMKDSFPLFQFFIRDTLLILFLVGLWHNHLEH